MARYKVYDLNQAKMIPLSYGNQSVEESFEYAERIRRCMIGGLRDEG